MFRSKRDTGVLAFKTEKVMKKYSAKNIYENKATFLKEIIHWRKLFVLSMIWILISTLIYSDYFTKISELEYWQILIIWAPIILSSFLIYNLIRDFDSETLIDRENGIFYCKNKKLSFNEVRAILIYVDANKVVISKGLLSISIYLKNRSDLLDLEKYIKEDLRFHCRFKRIKIDELFPFKFFS